MEDIALLDGFYESNCFLTPRKCIYKKTKEAYDYIAEHKIDTAILVFNKNIEKQEGVFADMIKIGEMQSGEDLHGIYVKDNVVLTVPFVGNPAASGVMEELADMGIKKFLAAGSAGLIDSNFDDDKFLVIDRAIRDEGGSFHYVEPSLYAYTSEEITNAITNTFDNLGVKYGVGTTWTMDTFYKESEERIKKRISQGATAVEMECATWCAVAQHLGLKFGQFLYFSDKVANNDWGKRGTREDRLNTKNQITLLCLEIAKNL